MKTFIANILALFRTNRTYRASLETGGSQKSARRRARNRRRAFRAAMASAIVALFLTTACASVPASLPDTMRQTCDLYQQVRPEVLKAREYAKANWNFLPEDVKQTLTKLDSYLPELDKAGSLICAVSSGTADRKSKIRWDDVLSTVVRAAAIASDLKKQGVI